MPFYSVHPLEEGENSGCLLGDSERTNSREREREREREIDEQCFKAQYYLWRLVSFSLTFQKRLCLVRIYFLLQWQNYYVLDTQYSGSELGCRVEYKGELVVNLVG